MAFCLMSNHFHLLIQVSSMPLTAIMQSFLTRYASYFNSRHGMTGHLFQGRYSAPHCAKDSYLLELVRYIHLNPVRAGLVRAPDDWHYSSHQAYLKGDAGLVEPSLALSLLDVDQAGARQSYRAFVAAAIGREDRPVDFFRPVEAMNRLEPKPAEEVEDRESGSDTLEVIARSVSVNLGLNMEAVLGPSRQHAVAFAKRAIMRRAVKQGIRPAKIAAFLNVTPSLVSKALSREEIGNNSRSDPLFR